MFCFRQTDLIVDSRSPLASRGEARNFEWGDETPKEG